jgi:hypothetical protein
VTIDCENGDLAAAASFWAQRGRLADDANVWP